MMRMKAEERKQELIDSALRLFMERGYKNVTIQDILKESRGQNGMFYHHFKSKDEIYEAAVQQFVLNTTQARIEVIGDYSMPFSRRMKQISESLKSDSEIVAFHFQLPSVDRVFLSEAVSGFIDELIAPLAAALIRAKTEGDILTDAVNQDNAEAAARFILHGSYSLAQVRPEEKEGNADADYIYLFMRELLKWKDSDL